MTSELLAGLGIFKTLYDSAKALKDINDTAIRNAAVIELQEKILAAREAQAALLERVSELEKEVADFETWETEKQRYELTTTARGGLAYTLRPDAQGSEPPHKICAACYQRRKKSPLQLVPRSLVHMEVGVPATYRCPECKSEVVA